MSIEPNRSARWGWVGGLALMTLAAAGNHTRAAETIPLNDEITVSFTIPANTYTNAFYFEVPENTRKFRLEMDGTPTANTDLDLFIRYGEPFPDANAYGLTPSNIERGFEWLADLSHYQSISFGNEEFVVVSEHAVRPPKAGRWHAAVVNFSAVPVNATLRLDLLPDEAPTPATITVRFDLPCTAADGAGCQCDLTGWNDPAPALPAPGNTGTTLGQQRRIALEEATRRIAQNFSTEAPIVIRACWAELEADATSAVLAQAGTEGLFIDDSGLFSGTASNPRPGRRQAFLPEAHAWYAAAPTTKSGGTSFCRVSGGPCESRVDVTATFNSLIDTPTGLGAASFYYGLNPPSQGAIDFIGVAMHEITHGLGFLSIISLGTGSAAVGTEFRGRDDIYERQILVTNRETPELLSRLSDSDRGNALTAGNGLQWISPEAVASPLNDPRPGEVGVRMYAPNPIRAGSSLSHLDLFYRGELMVPSSNAQLGARELFLAAPMLNAVGWDPAPRQFPTSPVPLSGQWYDRDRAGHGIDFQRSTPAPMATRSTACCSTATTRTAIPSGSWRLARWLMACFWPMPMSSTPAWSPISIRAIAFRHSAPTARAAGRCGWTSTRPKTALPAATAPSAMPISRWPHSAGPSTAPPATGAWNR